MQSSKKMKIISQKLSLSPSHHHPHTERYSLRVKSSLPYNNYENEPKTLRTQANNFYETRQSVFNRYNYENYNNYKYKNPLKPSKYPIDDKMLKKLKNIPDQGSSKNLQIIFCQHKYKDFVQKSNMEIKQIFSTQRSIPKYSSIQKMRAKSTNQSEQANLKISSSIATIHNTSKRKTTLSNYLNEFQTLQKLSQFMQRQHKLNQKYLLFQTNQIYRTVLLDILVYRFDFLKNLKKKARDILFKIVFDLNEINPLTKISIQDYIKFIQIFISRDAQDSLISMLTFYFLFRSQRTINMETALKSLDLLNGSIGKHKAIQKRLEEIFEKIENKSEEVYKELKQDKILLKTFIDLITQG